MGNLTRVTKENPCVGCGKDSWCMSDTNGDFLCMRVQTGHQLQMKSGDIGWWHRSGSPRPDYKPAPKESDAPKIDAEGMIQQWISETRIAWVEQMVKPLGITVKSACDLGVAWASSWNAWAWPMSDGNGKVIGIRLRYADGRKIAVTGSNAGLFIPDTAALRRVYLIEGPTDTAAMLDLGVYAIGRPSASGGSLQVKQTIERLGIKEAIIVADNDEDQYTPAGVKFNPGYDGAASLARILTIPRKIISLPTKDIREFVQQGGTKQLLDQIADSAVWEK